MGVPHCMYIELGHHVRLCNGSFKVLSQKTDLPRQGSKEIDALAWPAVKEGDAVGSMHHKCIGAISRKRYLKEPCTPPTP